MLPVRVRRILRRVRLATWSLADQVRRGDIAPGYGSLIGRGDFDAVGQEFLGHFRELAGLEPTDRVLDVGCGLGRMAAPLTRYLTQGEYRGFDIVEPAIHSCRRRFARFPAFRFDHVDVFNGKYNPQGTIPPSDFVFPYPEGAFDFAFATSVFTHMFPADTAQYLYEIARVLRPGGRCLATWFVMTPEAVELVQQGDSDISFPVRKGDTWQADPREPEAAIAYDPHLVRDLYSRAGLAVEEPFHYGRWSGSVGVSYQDIVVARRVTQPGGSSR
jgi:SAM-dependent methyltransferase